MRIPIGTENPEKTVYALYFRGCKTTPNLTLASPDVFRP